MSTGRMFRRSLLKGGGRLGMLAAAERILPAYVWSSEANAAAQTPQVNSNVGRFEHRRNSVSCQ